MMKSAQSDIADYFVAPQWLVNPSVHVMTSTRLALGNSIGCYSRANFGIHSGDSLTQVLENRLLLQHHLGLLTQPCWLVQNHGKEVVVWSAGQVTRDQVSADAAITRDRHVVCAVLTADCLPIVVADTEGTEVAVIHAGWRGLAKGIIAATLQRMRTPKERLQAWLGPAIAPQNYEVDELVYSAFSAQNKVFRQAFSLVGTGFWKFDLYQMARLQLEQYHIKNVVGGDFDTFSDEKLFYSHRRDAGHTGRMATLAWLK